MSHGTCLRRFCLNKPLVDDSRIRVCLEHLQIVKGWGRLNRDLGVTHTRWQLGLLSGYSFYTPAPLSLHRLGGTAVIPISFRDSASPLLPLPVSSVPALARPLRIWQEHEHGHQFQSPPQTSCEMSGVLLVPLSHGFLICKTRGWYLTGLRRSS